VGSVDGVMIRVQNARVEDSKRSRAYHVLRCIDVLSVDVLFR
jgi:hypothetical protein